MLYGCRIANSCLPAEWLDLELPNRRHFRFKHDCLCLPGLPNRGLSLQCLHTPQSPHIYPFHSCKSSCTYRVEKDCIKAELYRKPVESKESTWVHGFLCLIVLLVWRFCKATQYTSKYSFKHESAFHSIHQRVLPSTLVTSHIMRNLGKTLTCMKCVQQLHHPWQFK